ncbi:uncharacterized protein LOC134180637 [Corticium candelabrum]|uniref:uncharacterized protein LOC134180637 n=1 Tax=Corticium candelabrum TaxID=121492 RepID=UPI002E25726E|nr:uncharacterized protein LOC134180637 [Corticium candelabrum]
MSTHHHNKENSDDARTEKEIDESTARLLRSTSVDRFGPVVVVGLTVPSVGFGKLSLTTEPFHHIDKIPDIAPMELKIEEGLPRMNLTDSDKNLFLKFRSPEVTCQVAVTLEKNPVEEPSTLTDWEVIIVQVVNENEEIHAYGAARDSEEVDFMLNQYFQVDGRSYEAPILDVDGRTCTCNMKDPAYSSTARQPFDIQVVLDKKFLFGKLSCRDRIESMARVSFRPRSETDPDMRSFFSKHSNLLTADEYYLNRIEKRSSMFTYLTIYNTNSREVYTPMAVQWFFDCKLRRVTGTDEFEWYETSCNQLSPVAWTESRPFGFPYLSSRILERHELRCSSSSDGRLCKGYATFNNSVRFEARMIK